MARGTAVGEAVVSQASTDAYRSSYDRLFPNGGPKRGRWVQDPTTGELVDAASYVPPARAVDAPVLAGRFYEDIRMTDGTVIQSRAQYQEHLRRKGVTNASDFSPEYYERARREKAAEQDHATERAVREQFARVEHLTQATYDREAAERARRRRERGD